MDPITLAVVTSGLTLVATECAKGVASQAGKDLWSQARTLLGLSESPASSSAKAIAEKLSSDPSLLAQVKLLVEGYVTHTGATQSANQLVGEVHAEKSAVVQNAGTINIH